MKTQTYGIGTLVLSVQSLPVDFWTTNIPLALAAAHEKKDNNWTMKYLVSAYNNYHTNRENGETQDNPQDELKHDGKAEWEKQTDGNYYVKYTEGPSDKLWMEEKDLNYLTRLVREGTLMQKDPTWKEVLEKWEPESKSTAAIARVESEIKACPETKAEERETKKPKPM